MPREKKRYRRVSLKTWGDKKFRELSKAQPNAQTLWLFLITGPHTTSIPGVLGGIGKAGLAESLDWPLAELQSCWDEITAKQMGEADWRAPLIWLPKGMVHNPPESLNVVKSWASTFDTLPECELKAKIEGEISKFLETKGIGYVQAFAQAMSQGMRHTEAETGTETEAEAETVLRDNARHATSLVIPGTTKLRTNHPVRDLLTVHDVAFQARYNERPPQYGGREAKVADDLIRQHGFDKAAQLALQLFASTDAFFVKSGHGFGLLANNTIQSKLIAELSGKGPKGDGMDGLRDFVNGR